MSPACLDPECGEPARAKGRCRRHYMAEYRRTHPDRRRCADCLCCGEFRTIHGRGLCDRCYLYNRTHGTLAQPRVSASPHVPFAVRLRDAASGRGIDDCHPWGGHVDDRGYGSSGGRWAHVEAWVAAGNPPPEPGQHVDHTCCWGSGCSGGNTCPHRRCVNARHLRVVSPAENVAKQANVRSLVCKRNHPKTPEYGYRNSQGSWRCRPCHVIRQQQYEARKRKRSAAA